MRPRIESRRGLRGPLRQFGINDVAPLPFFLKVDPREGRDAFLILFLDQKAEYEGAAREIHKASCADCVAVEIVLSD